MNLKSSETDSNSTAPKLVKHVQENGRDVKVFDDQFVIGSITPLSDSVKSNARPSVESPEKNAEATCQPREIYRTWGEDLRGL